MDITTPLGWVLAAVLIVISIGFDKLSNFYDVSSIEIVVGGTIAALIACYPLNMLKNIPKHIGVLMKGNKFNTPKVIDQVVDLAMVARQSGLLALEEKADEITEPFFKQAVLMIVDANDPDKVRSLLEKQVDEMAERHEANRGMYLKGSALAPAFGMIGTLVGLINMLKGLDLTGSGGASSLGQDMSIALITTFYGSVLSNVLFHPIAQKLQVRESEEELYDTVIIEGVLAIQAGENPKYIREHLVSALPGSEQKKLLAKEESRGSAAPSTDGGGDQ
ncbi:MAG: MotA/TolQ/ExbB proton channel family protein [Lachnospiraceae bacterium]|jgi:chemotaxis protein MotA|nr:MotA/TolQ/ExbB proton channel family protein [Lachnospiraceae bacterium]MCH4028482.1 MotA/TolQ/ExbB proton channel family protein [Lachnospiraceae bacterium]MCH4066332.1 MotA/TolQ/ExbB proton channel family protein [Lachnospiraceae bacterium]MCH4112362.1 MotA/TolQ/ExbB proton channel family protein [Lachnospiraceae bacterium]MCI1353341.1 MotA/TolQ/ExbB proton channel family protein [Lachnospiraceae bacterium]